MYAGGGEAGAFNTLSASGPRLKEKTCAPISVLRSSMLAITYRTNSKSNGKKKATTDEARRGDKGQQDKIHLPAPLSLQGD